MSKRLLWSVVLGLLLTSVPVWAAPMQDGTVAYIYRNPDGGAFRILDCHLSGGDRFRIDYRFGDGTAHTTIIYRNDKQQVWTLYLDSKEYAQNDIPSSRWEEALMHIFAPDFLKTKKTGETTLLGYPCDIYETESDGWTTTSTVVQGLNVVLRSELREKERLVQTMEATELRLEKPASSLFEIPAGWVRAK